MLGDDAAPFNDDNLAMIVATPIISSHFNFPAPEAPIYAHDIYVIISL